MRQMLIALSALVISLPAQAESPYPEDLVRFGDHCTPAKAVAMIDANWFVDNEITDWIPVANSARILHSNDGKPYVCLRAFTYVTSEYPDRQYFGVTALIVP